MGNSAIRGCTTVSTSVRLLQADGKVLEFPDPVLAIRVMQDYPGHSVVRYNSHSQTRQSSSPSAAAAAAASSSSSSTSSSSSSSSSRNGHHAHGQNDHYLQEAALAHGCKFPIASQPQPIRKVAILRADEELQPGNTYYLLPVPRQASSTARLSNKKQTFKSPKSSSKVGSSYEYEPERRSSEKRSHKTFRRSSSLPQAREMQQQHAKQAVAVVGFEAPIPMPRQSLGRLLMEGRSSSVGSNGGSSSSQQQNSLQMQMHETFDMLESRRCRPLTQRRTRRSPQVGWKPVLESIPEYKSPDLQPRAFLPIYMPDRPKSAPIFISQTVQ